MKKLLFLGVIFVMILFVGCGSSKNEDKTDSGEAASDEDTNIDDTDSGNSGGYSDGCSTKTSYGSTSFTRDESNVFNDCARETQKS